LGWASPREGAFFFKQTTEIQTKKQEHKAIEIN
jgi:hypothetical protein